MSDAYLAGDQFWSLINALVTARPQSPFGGTLEASDYVAILGEARGIWPASVLDDPARGYQLRRANHVSSEGQAAQALETLLDVDDF